MALRALVLGKNLAEKRAELAEMETRSAEFETREKELETAINEMTAESTAEERSAVDEAVSSFEAEKAELEEKKINLTREIGEIEAELAELEAKQNEGNNEKLRKVDEKEMENRETKVLESAEYRSAFFKNLMGQELTDEETMALRADYTATTGDTTYHADYLLPTQTVNKIWDLIHAKHAIMSDITMYRTGIAIEVVKRTAISQGDATSVSENAANNDEINTFAKVTLSGKDFSKHYNMSYAMAKMSIDAFEDFIVNEIASRIGHAMASDVVTQILTDYDDANNEIESANVGKFVWADVTSAFGVIEGADALTVYASRGTIYNYLASMVDTTGRPIFQSDVHEDIEGYLLGAPVKIEDSVTAGTLLIGDPKNVVYNLIQDVIVESDKDIKKHVITYSGYARGEAALVAPKSFATLNIKNS